MSTKLKIIFLENHLSVRGTTNAVFNYALYNETVLGNESLIVTRPFEMFRGREDVSEDIYLKFTQRFRVLYYNHPSHIQAIIDTEKPDWIYVLKLGNTSDGLCGFRGVKTFVHCVGPPTEPHGDVYSTISEWWTNEFRLPDGSKANVLPHIVSIDEEEKGDLREELGIPKDAVVWGRHGGYSTFDMVKAQRAVDRVSAARPDVYFVFLHTKPFCSPRPNVIHLPATVDEKRKRRFINTCDAMVYGREIGESFGLAIGEFSRANKPIFCSTTDDKGKLMMERYHKTVLGDQAYWYDTEEDLVGLMMNYTTARRDEDRSKDWDMYSAYSPQNVMKIFDGLVRSK